MFVFVFAFVFAFVCNVPAFADDEDPVADDTTVVGASATYYERAWSAESNTITTTAKNASNATGLNNTKNKWTSAVNLLQSDVTIEGVSEIQSATRLLLNDGYTLTISGDLNIGSGKTLKIYGTSTDVSSRVVVTGNISGGTLEIHGGTIEVLGSSDLTALTVYGKGLVLSGDMKVTGDVNIYSGDVTAGKLTSDVALNIYNATVSADTISGKSISVYSADVTAETTITSSGDLDIYYATVNAETLAGTDIDIHYATVEAGTISGDSLVIYSGDITAAKSIKGNTLIDIYNGTVSADTIGGSREEGSEGSTITLHGEVGSVTATTIGLSNDVVILDHSGNQNFTITTKKPESDISYRGTVKISGDKIFFNEGKQIHYGGTLGDNHKKEISGVTLKPYTNSDVFVISLVSSEISAPTSQDNKNLKLTVSIDLSAARMNATFNVYIAGAENSTSKDFKANGYAIYYNFNGTVTSDDTFTTPQPFTMLGKSVSVDVYVKAQTYTISYDLADGQWGTNADHPETYTYSTNVVVSSPDRSGYEFLGWTGGVLSGDGKTVLSNDEKTYVKNVVNLSIDRGSTGNRLYTASWDIITYSISYDLYGGTFGSTQYYVSYDVESADFNLATPTKKGYTFTGWTLSEDSSSTASTDLTISKGTIGNRTYVANWELKVYKISYDLGVLTEWPENASYRTSYDVTTEKFTISSLDKTGYTFLGWWGGVVSGDGIPYSSDKSYVSNMMNLSIDKGSSGDRYYTASWDIIPYTITYSGDTGAVYESGKKPTSYTVVSGATIGVPTLNGYTFKGWTGGLVSTDNKTIITYDVEGSTSEIKIKSGDIGNRLYTAAWSPKMYRITYSLGNGGSWDVSADSHPSLYYSSTATFSIDVPVRTGYNFKGWIISGDSEEDANNPFYIEQGSDGNYNLVAVWEVATYTISYDLGLASADWPANATHPTWYAYTSEDFKISSPDIKTIGYEFKGWTGGVLSSDGETVLSQDTYKPYYVTNELNLTIETHSSADRKYTAQWGVVSREISYDLGSYGYWPDGVTASTDYDLVKSSFSIPVPVSKTVSFDHWYLTITIDDETTWSGDVSSSDAKIISKDIFASSDVLFGYRLYKAVWNVQTYEISYDLQGGELADDVTNPTSYDVNTTAFTLNNPTKTGYTFSGWMLSVDATPGTAVTTVTISPDITYGYKKYVASWDINIYKITYNLGDAYLPDSKVNSASYTVETPTFTLVNPVNNDSSLVFNGWTGGTRNSDNSLNNEATNAQTVTIPQGSTGDRYYAANWAKDADVLKWAGHNLALDGTLKINFFVYIPDGSEDNYVMEFDVSGDTSLNPNAVTYSYTDTSGDLPIYGFACNINSAQMANKITAALYEKGASEGSTPVLEQTYTVVDYLNTMKSLESYYTDKNKEYVNDLMHAIRDYGHFVQPMLAAAKGWTIGVDYAEVSSDTTYDTTKISNVMNEATEYKIVRDFSSDPDVTNVGFALALGSDTTIILYVDVVDGYAGTVTATCEGTSKMTVTKASDTEYLVQIRGIMAHQLDTTYTVNITTSSGTFPVKVSAFSYVDAIINSTNDDLLTEENINAVISLYDYGNATATYAEEESKEGGN